MTSITHEVLIARGYRRHEAPTPSLATALYQRPVRTPDGDTSYHLNCYYYDRSRYGPNEPDGWQWEVYLYAAEGGEDAFRVTLLGTWGIDDAEAFFARAYWRMGCVPARRKEVPR